jgi:hypothetical protein
MWRPDGTLVELKEILHLIPENDLVWSFFEFEGVGEPPHGLTMDGFERLAQEDISGYVFSWAELTRFAAGLGQVINCFLAAVEEPARLEQVGETFDSGDGAVCFIRGFDSGSWEMKVDRASASAAVFSRLLSGWQGLDR